MSTGTNNGSSTPWLAFLVGGLLVAVVAIGLFVYMGGRLAPPSQETSKIEFNVKPPASEPAN